MHSRVHRLALRKLRNVVSAKASRENKVKRLTILEEENDMLARENSSIVLENGTLKRQNSTLLEQVGEALVFALSDRPMMLKPL
jgi:hypothetical protein